MSLTPIILRPLSPRGQPIATTYRLRLVDAQNRQADALSVADGSPVVGELEGTIPTTPGGLTIEIIPQPQLATQGGVATWWHLLLQTTTSVSAWRLHVPESANPLDMWALVAASTAPAEAAGLMIARIAALEANQLPAPGIPGRVLIDNGTTWVASETLPIEDPPA